MLPNDIARHCQLQPNNNIDSSDGNLEDIFVETQDVNYIKDSSAFDLRPDRASNGNERAAFVS